MDEQPNDQKLDHAAPEIRDMRFYEMLADGFTTREVAAENKVTKMTVQRSLNRLERAFGPLFVREHGKSMSLTERGKTIRAQMQPVLCSYAACIREAKGDTRTITLGFTAVSGALIAEALKTSAEFDHVRIRELYSSEMRQLVQRGDLDIGVAFDLRSASLGEQDLVAHKVLSQSLNLVIPAERAVLKLRSTKKKVEGLRHCFIQKDLSPEFHEATLSWLKKQGVTEPLHDERSSCTNAGELATLVATQKYFCVLPPLCGTFAPKNVVYQPIADIDFEANLFAFFRKDDPRVKERLKPLARLIEVVAKNGTVATRPSPRRSRARTAP